jgi:two-component system CheB/CheR fusion protein
MPEPADPSAPGLDLTIEAKLRAAFELSPTVLAITTAGEGRLLDVNDAFTRLHGYTRDEVIGRTVSELDLWVNPEQRRQALATIQSGAPVRNVEVRLRTKDGEERVCILSADLVVIDGRRCILSALTDITDRARAEEALRESERRFLLAFEANPLPMSITRWPDGVHLEVNEAAVRHSGFAREEMLGRTKVELGFWVTPEQRESMTRQIEAHGAVRDFEVSFRTRGGQLRQLLVNCQPMTFAGVRAVLNVAIDITERNALESENRARREQAEALAESLRQADRAKDEFLAMLGHELRNPLGTISSALGLLDASGYPERDRRVVGVVRRQTAQLARLVDDLLDVSRLTSGRIQLQRAPVELHALARRCLAALAESGRSAAHEVALEGGPAYAEGDAARLEQVVTNLLDNALKYTRPGGRIVVGTSTVGREAMLRVQDTGQGIEPDLLPRVFDLFVQEPQGLDRARGGLGLGLAVVKRLVELHGGSVSARSPGPGRGADFTVRLPATPPAPPTAGRPAPPPTAAVRPRRRVLVVEDNSDAREMLCMALEAAGHVVEEAEDGPTGLARLASFRPDVALIDVGLPGLDGYAVARIARSRADTRAIRLVALTGYGQSEDRARALSAGFDRHVTKPVDPLVLDDLVRGL